MVSPHTIRKCEFVSDRHKLQEAGTQSKVILIILSMVCINYFSIYEHLSLHLFAPVFVLVFVLISNFRFRLTFNFNKKEPQTYHSFSK